MKKKLLALGMILTLLTGTVTVSAAQIPVVRLNDAEEFEYYSDENGTKIDSLSLNEFAGMAPGDERTQTICLENDSEDMVNFYISQKTLDTLENDNQASGGAYKFNLQVGDNLEDAESLLDSEAGGYDANGNGSSNGLADIDELEDYAFLATVESGDHVYLYLTLKLEGEGNDNRATNDYTEAVAKLQLSFRAYKVNHKVTKEKDKVIIDKKTKIKTVKKVVPVQTGDVFKYGGFIILFGVGVTLIVVAAVKSRKGGKE